MFNEKDVRPEQALFKPDKEQPKVYKAHKDRVFDLSFNKTGEYLVTASGDSKVMVWDVNHDCVQVAELKGHTEPVEKVACHPTDANVLLSASSDKVIKLWDIRAKSSVRSEKTKGHNLNLVWRPDGLQFASYTKDQTANFFDINKPGQMSTLKFDNVTLKDGTTLNDVGLNDISWDVTGNVFMAATSEKDHSLLLFDGNKIEFPAVMSLTLHAGTCFYMAIDPSGKYVATGGVDNTIALLDANEFIAEKYITQVSAQLLQMSFSHDGLYLATGSEQNSINIYDTRTAELIQIIETPSFQYPVAWHPQKYILAFAGEEKQGKNDKFEGTFRIIGLGKSTGLPTAPGASQAPALVPMSQETIPVQAFPSTIN